MLSKYCKACKLQGHDESNCRVLHPELKRVEYGDDKGKIVDEMAGNDKVKGKNVDVEGAKEDFP